MYGIQDMIYMMLDLYCVYNCIIIMLTEQIITFSYLRNGLISLTVSMVCMMRILTNRMFRKGIIIECVMFEYMRG